MERKEFNIIIAVVVVVVIFLGVLGGGVAWFTLYRELQMQRAQLAEIRAELKANELNSPFPRLFRPPQTSFPFPQRPAIPQPAVPSAPRITAHAFDSVEGQMRAKGKHWVRVPDEIVVGGYVEDTLDNREGVPFGRGAIGKVVSLGPGDDGAMGAMVDFGRGYVAGIKLTELSVIRFVPEDSNTK
jgi:hypothetical protein